MADIKAIASTNWSLTTTWGGGVVPVAGDNVYSNGFTVPINQSITVALITNEANVGIGAVVGGSFTVSGDFTITANIVGGTINSLALNSGTINIIGNLSVGAGANGRAVQVNGPGTIVNVVGNLTAGTGGANAMVLINISSATITVTGTVTGNTAAGAYNNGSGTIIINGNVIGGISFPGAYNQSVGLMTINGIAIGHATANIAGVWNIVTSLGTVQVQGVEYGANGSTPTAGWIRFANNALNTCKVLKQNLTTVTLQDIANVANVLPANSDVRFQVIFNLGNNVGTAHIPGAESTGAGVPVDHTVGIAQLTGDDVLNAINASALALAERLRNVATVESVAEQLDAALND